MGEKYTQVHELEVSTIVPGKDDLITVLYYQFDKTEELKECLSNLIDGVHPLNLVEIKITMNELK